MMTMTTATATTSKAYEFCKQSVRRKTTPKYVKKQMREWMRIAEGKNKKYKVSIKKLKQVGEHPQDTDHAEGPEGRQKPVPVHYRISVVILHGHAMHGL